MEITPNFTNKGLARIPPWPNQYHQIYLLQFQKDNKKQLFLNVNPLVESVLICVAVMWVTKMLLAITQFVNVSSPFFYRHRIVTMTLMQHRDVLWVIRILLTWSQQSLLAIETHGISHLMMQWYQRYYVYFYVVDFTSPSISDLRVWWIFLFIGRSCARE